MRVDDGTVDVNGVNWITVSAGTLTDLGNGHVEITTGGGGGGALTVQLADGSVVVGGVTDLQFNQAVVYFDGYWGRFSPRRSWKPLVFNYRSRTNYPYTKRSRKH